MGALSANIGDTVQATLSASGSVVGTGGTKVQLYNDIAHTILQDTAYTNHGGLFRWTNVSVNNVSQGAADFYTACIEILQNIGWGGQYTYTVTDLSAAPLPGALNGVGTGMGTTAKDALTMLWQQHYASVGTDQTLAGALQLATWKLVYDQGSILDLTLGRVVATQNFGSELTTAQNWLDNLSGNGSLSMVALTSPTNQDQAFAALPSATNQSVLPSPVPEPSTIVVWCLLGVLGFSHSRWRRT
jgi:hypothetical protein